MKDVTNRLPEKGPQGFFVSEEESIYYETYGRGETVVLCHGLGGNHAIWYQQVPALSRHYRVVIWDQRGFGRSTNDANQSGPAAAVKDLTALLDHLHVEAATIIGQSMGGWAALGMAIRYPEKVRRLVLADTIAGIYTPDITAACDISDKKRPAPETLIFGQHPAVGHQLMQQDLAQSFLYSQIGSITPPPPADMRGLLRNTAYPLAAVHALNIPALFIVGGNDPIFSPQTIREAAAQIPGAHLVEIPDTGHSPYFESPAHWNRIVLAFLEDQDNPVS